MGNKYPTLQKEYHGAGQDGKKKICEMIFLFDTSILFFTHRSFIFMKKSKVEKGNLTDLDKDTPNQEPHSSATASGNRRLLIMVYMTVVNLYRMSQYLYMPTLPLYVKSKTDNLTMVGVVLAMYGLWQTLVRIPLGMAADWAG